MLDHDAMAFGIQKWTLVVERLYPLEGHIIVTFNIQIITVLICLECLLIFMLDIE